MNSLRPSAPAWLAQARGVNALTLALKQLVEGNFRGVAVTGEVSGDRLGQGHLYFTLKDEAAQIPCVIWKSTLARLRVGPRAGARVALRGDIQIYPPHGKYQLVVSDVHDIGAGAIDAELRALAERLRAEGLFAPERKRPLPRVPRRVGVVTAPNGAALQDVLRVMRDRFPVDLLLAPARVQGEGAAATLVAGLQALAATPGVDVILVTRGGGSAEDLSAFNDEALVRAIAACPVPVVSAVGHEIDLVLADYAADRRAPTPSAAATLIVPDHAELMAALEDQRDRLDAALERRLGEAAMRLDRLAANLAPPLERQLHRASRRLDAVTRRLDSARPALRLAAQRARLDQLTRALSVAAGRRLGAERARLDVSERQLAVLSPLASLARGYAIVRRDDGGIVRAAAEVAPEARVEVIVHDGRFHARREGDPDTKPR